MLSIPRDRPPLHWRTFLCWGALLTIEWLVVYAGANCLTAMHSYRLQLDTAVDRNMPFEPAAAFIYLSLFPMLWLSLILLRSDEQLRSFARALALLIALSGLGFVLLPAAGIDVPSSTSGVVGAVFTFADWINLSHNYLPSLHVAMAVVCAICYGRTAPPKAVIFYSAWAAMIALATLLTRQHYVIDVIAGGVLGAVVSIRLASDGPDRAEFRT